jgi:hypothetical protein
MEGPIPQNEKKKYCMIRLEELKKSWESTGDAIMLDGWIDGKCSVTHTFV